MRKGEPGDLLCLRLIVLFKNSPDNQALRELIESGALDNLRFLGLAQSFISDHDLDLIMSRLIKVNKSSLNDHFLMRQKVVGAGSFSMFVFGRCSSPRAYQSHANLGAAQCMAAVWRLVPCFAGWRRGRHSRHQRNVTQ